MDIQSANQQLTDLEKFVKPKSLKDVKSLIEKL
jgi:hypothetical protein